jgi:hypothetical protein
VRRLRFPSAPGVYRAQLRYKSGPGRGFSSIVLSCTVIMKSEAHLNY